MDGEEDPKEDWPFKEINGHTYRYGRYNLETNEPEFESGEWCCDCGIKIEYSDMACRNRNSNRGTGKETPAVRGKEEVRPIKKLKQVDMEDLFNL